MKKKISFILALTMLLSGCNADRKTDQSTTEISAITTAETTVVTTTTKAETAITTTTPSEITTTAETEERVKAESFDFNFTLEDFTMDLSVFEKYFYGSWDEQNKYPMRITFTYKEDSFVEGRYYCIGFYEDETGGYMLTMNGGVHELYFVLADSSDTMYALIDFNIDYKHLGYCAVYKADENNSKLSRELTAGTLDSMGVLKIKDDYGFDIKSFNSFTDAYGTEWRKYDITCTAEDQGEPHYTLEAEPTEDEIRFSQCYYCVTEPHKTRLWKITAENQNGEWIITDTLSDFSDESMSGCNTAEKAEQSMAEITTVKTAEATTVTTTTKTETTSATTTSVTDLEAVEEIPVCDVRAIEYLTEIEKCEGFADTLDMGADAVIADLDNDGSPELIIQICSMISISAVFGIDENGAYRASVSKDSIISESTGDVSYVGEPPVGYIIDREPQFFARYWSGGSCGGEGGWARLVLSDMEIKTEPLAKYEMYRDGFAKVYEYSDFDNEEEYNKYVSDYFLSHRSAQTIKFRLLDVEKSEYRALVLQQLEKYFTEN